MKVTVSRGGVGEDIDKQKAYCKRKQSVLVDDSSDAVSLLERTLVTLFFPNAPENQSGNGCEDK